MEKVLSQDLMQALQEVRDDIRGTKALPRQRYNIPNPVDVKAIREGLDMTQKDFAAAFCFSLSAVRHWEQGLRTPEAPIRAYLQVIAHKSEVVRGVLH